MSNMNEFISIIHARLCLFSLSAIYFRDPRETRAQPSLIDLCSIMYDRAMRDIAGRIAITFALSLPARTLTENVKQILITSSHRIHRIAGNLGTCFQRYAEGIGYAYKKSPKVGSTSSCYQLQRSFARWSLELLRWLSIITSIIITFNCWLTLIVKC